MNYEREFLLNEFEKRCDQAWEKFISRLSERKKENVVKNYVLIKTFFLGRYMEHIHEKRADFFKFLTDKEERKKRAKQDIKDIKQICKNFDLLN